MKVTIKLIAIFTLVLACVYVVRQVGILKTPQIFLEKATTDGYKGLSLGRYYEVSIPPTKVDNYLSADYRLWIPDRVRTVRGLIIKQHGCGDPAAGSGLEHANDLQWQALALKHNFALLGTKLPSGNKPCEYWALINYGSGAAFLKALRALAQKSKHPELEGVPWVLWGHSGGADWVAQMLQQYPERTIAMVGVRGGGFLLLGSNPTLVGIPVLFASGKNDPYASETLDLPKRVFLRYRKMSAPWTFAVEANAAHESGDTRLLAIPYLDAVITARVATQSTPPNPIDGRTGWVGDINTHEVAPVNQYKGNILETVWLPNQETALKWQEYVSTGKIEPTSKPAAPTDVHVTRIGETDAILRWKFTPDLENGLPSFRIYRNNSLIGTIQGQEHDFGDAAVPPNVALEIRDENVTPNSSYKVAAFNTFGESISPATSLNVSK